MLVGLTDLEICHPDEGHRLPGRPGRGYLRPGWPH